MAEYNKERFYWLKLKRDFFKRHDIQIIESMPNGKDYVLFYLKLMVESIDHDGALRFSDTIPYNEQMLSVVTNTNIDIVRSAIKMLNELGMIEVLDDQTLYLKEVKALIGSQSVGAEKKQIQLQNRCEKIVGGQKVEKIPPEKEKECLLKILKNKLSSAGAYTGVFDDLIDEILEALVAGTELEEELTLNGTRYNAGTFERIAEHITFDQVAKIANRLLQRKGEIQNREKYIQCMLAECFGIGDSDE
ncbi:MAG: phage replisome organizer N-terminal domain-containing protein [Christensenellales bacterium]